MASNSAQETRFIFRGNAVALGGRVNSIGGERVARAVPTPCAASLPIAGGLSRGDAQPSGFEDIFSWGNCIAESRGEPGEDGSQVTTVTASVTAFTAVNDPVKFAAGELTAVVTSRHPRKGLPSIVPEKIVFGGDNGIFLEDKRITVVTDLDDFQKFGSFDAFEKQYRSNRAFFRKYARRCHRPGRKSPEFGERLPRVTGGYVVTSIVGSIRWGDQDIPGYVLERTGFGKIYFGEIVMNEYNRRLTLLRLKMGSRADADMVCGEVDTNGSFEP